MIVRSIVVGFGLFAATGSVAEDYPADCEKLDQYTFTRPDVSENCDEVLPQLKDTLARELQWRQAQFQTGCLSQEAFDKLAEEAKRRIVDADNLACSEGQAYFND
jgi:hypothetical protein